MTSLKLLPQLARVCGATWLYALVAAAIPATIQADENKPIPVAEVKHEGDVDFEREILPILRRSCLACHNATVAESDLVLETPQTILKGGGLGPAVVPKKSGESLFLKSAAHIDEPIMPPEGNDKGAKNLTSQELGLIKLWIDQGAKGEVRGLAGPVNWQPLPPGVNPIYAVAISPDGQYVAAGRANQIFIYHSGSKREVGRLTDPELLKTAKNDRPGLAHLDLVQSLAFDPSGSLLASGGYRTVKLWRRPANVKLAQWSGLEAAGKSLAISRDGKRAAIGQENGAIQLFDVATGKVIHTLTGHGATVTGLSFSADGARLASGSLDKTLRIWNIGDGKQVATIDGPAPINALVFVNKDQQLAAGCADNLIRIWQTPTGQAENKEPPKPVHELKGHGEPVNSLAAMGPGEMQLVSGAQDNTARLWNVADGKPIRTFNHGGPVTAVAARPDAKRIATTSSNNTAKLWDATNGKEVAVLKGDHRTQIKVEDVTRAVALAKQRIDLTKKDLTAANNRKKSEDENLKKATEAKNKVAEDLKKKIEAAKKPLADKAAGDKALADAKTKATDAEQAKKTADTNVANAAQAIKKAQDALPAFVKALQAAQANVPPIAKKKAAALAQVAATENDFKAAEATLAEARQNLKTPQINVEGAAKKIQAAEANLKAAQLAVTLGEKAVAELEQAKKNAGVAAGGPEGQDNDKTKKLDEALVKAKADLEQAVKKLQSTEEDLKANQLVKINLLKTLAVAQAHTKPVETAAAQAQGKVKQAQNELQSVVKELTTAQKKVEAAQTAKTDAEKAVADAVAAKTAMDAAAKNAQTALTQAQNAVKQAEANAKKLADAAQKAVDAKNASERNLKGAERTETRAKQSVAKAAAEIPKTDAKVKQREADHQAQQAALGASKEAAAALEKPILTASFSPDGKSLATAGGDQQVHTWDADTGAPLESYQGQGAVVVATAFTSAGDVISVGGNNSLVVWDGDPVWKLERSIGGVDTPMHLVDRVTALDFSSDGKLLAIGSGEPSRSGQIRIYNVADGSLVREIKEPHSDSVFCVEFSPDDQYLASCGADRFVKVFETATGKFVKSFEGHTHHVLGVTWRADGRVLASSGADNVIKVWNFLTGDQQRTISGFGKEVTSVQFLAIGNNVVASSGDQKVAIKRTDNGGNIRNFGGAKDFVYSADASANGKLIVAGGQDSVLRIWEDNGKVVVAFEPPKAADQTAAK